MYCFALNGDSGKKWVCINTHVNCINEILATYSLMDLSLFMDQVVFLLEAKTKFLFPLFVYIKTMCKLGKAEGGGSGGAALPSQNVE